MRARTLGCWPVDVPDSTPKWSLEGTPGGEVIRGAVCDHLTGVSSAFPAGTELVGPGIESHAEAPLIAPDGQLLGILCAFDREPMQADPRRVLILRVFAARAAAELARLRVEKTLAESEQRYRDLYGEAPIAYVLEDLESRSSAPTVRPADPGRQARGDGGRPWSRSLRLVFGAFQVVYAAARVEAGERWERWRAWGVFTFRRRRRCFASARKS